MIVSRALCTTLVCLGGGLTVAWFVFAAYWTRSLVSVGPSLDDFKHRVRSLFRGVEIEPISLSTNQSSTLLNCNILEDPDGQLCVHTYHEGVLFPGYDILFDGYLLTQNLEKTIFIQWSNEDWSVSEDSFKKAIVQKYENVPNIQFKIFDPLEYAVDTCFEDRPEFLYRTSIAKYGLRDWSNVVRILLLHKFGGVWVDSDTLPLADFLTIHNAKDVDNALVAGYSGNKPKDVGDKEKGIFNNNFLYMVHPHIREKFVEVACEFRRLPLGTTNKKGEEEFRNVIPLVGDDQHEMRVMNKWLYNDGALRRCWMRDDCNLRRIHLGNLDPLWFRTGDLYSICERIIQTMYKYVENFNEMLQKRAAYNSTDYLLSYPWDKHVYTVHHRASHCRSITGLTGMIEWFYKLVSTRMMGRSPHNVPSRAVDFLTFDPFEVPKANHDVLFYPLLIVVFSEPQAFESRQILRSLYDDPTWFREIYASLSHRYKTLFIVPYTSENNFNGRLHAELARYEDLILVDPDEKSSKTASVGMLSAPFVRGVLKILNTFESRFMLLIRSDSTFIHVPNFYKILSYVSADAIFNKEKPVPSFVMTQNGNERNSSAVTTPFIQFPSQHSFVAFSRNALPALLGLSEGDQIEERGNLLESQLEEECRLTSPPSTLEAALGRFSSKHFTGEVAKDEEGHLMAQVPDIVFGDSWAYFYGDEKAMGKFLQVPSLTGEATDKKCTKYPKNSPQKKKDHDVDKYEGLLNPNTTFVLNVPCLTAFKGLDTASKRF